MSSIGHVASGCTRGLLAGLLAVFLVPGNTATSPLIVGWTNAQAQTPASVPARIPPDQLDSLVAPIALYPDPLLAQTLAASTYPLELLQLHQWLAKNPGLKDKALLDAVSRQPWDPSVQAMAAVPDVVTRLANDIQWTTDLGNAFLAQENDVMDAVQRMRLKAENMGTLQSTPQQTVETRVVENKSVVVIEQANPEVLYVPSYNPTVVYGASVYPYPPIYYPPAGYYAGRAIAFGTGLAIGAAWNGGWGWGANWGHNDITVNRYNSFNRNAYARGASYRGSTWQHNAAHRGGTPYRDRATANRYGGTARGDSLAARQTGARQQIQRQGGTARSAVGTTGFQNRAGAGAGQRGTGTAGSRAGNVGSRAGSGAGSRAGTGYANRPSSSMATRTGGSRDLSRPSGSSNRGAFSGSHDRFNGSSARASSNRGSHSMRSSGSFGGSRGGFSGGGRSRGGGGFGGGGRGGGGRGGGRR